MKGIETLKDAVDYLKMVGYRVYGTGNGWLLVNDEEEIYGDFDGLIPLARELQREMRLV